MVDFCLGDDASATVALGPEVSARYAGLDLELELPNGRHLIRRSFVPSFGLLTRIRIDDELEVAPRAFSDWMLEQLGWPLIEIPRGRVAELATELVPLTFRTLWRHIFRREDSWLVFANQEQEFHRRAVLSFFLGLAEQRYSNVDFQLAATERRAAELREQLASLDRLTDETVRQVARELGLPETTSRTLQERDALLANEAASIDLRREEVTRSLQATEGFVGEAAARFDIVSRDLVTLRARIGGLREALDGYQAARAANIAELAKLERAASSVELISALPVTMCPVCGQTPPHARDWPEATSRCYLCDQPVVADIRDRRIRLEGEVVGREKGELDEVIIRTETELSVLERSAQTLLAERQRLGSQIDAERRDLLAPFVGQLEEMSRRLGAIEQQRAALTGLGGLLARRSALNAELEHAIRAVDHADAAARAVASSRHETHRRCAAFADRMTEFLERLTVEPWQFGRITIAEEELSFYVGGGPWDIVLGGESRVLFLLSYQYALLHLAKDLPSASHAPGLAVLDNPLQQGIAGRVIAEAMDQLLVAAANGAGQVVATLPHALPLRSQPVIHRLSVQYGATD
ncbi:MAG: hypothetical protein ACRDLL_01240 [Solirubrobacterales bacterium]